MSTAAPTGTTPNFKTALGTQLVVAHGRLRRRRRRRQTGLAVAVVAIVALFATASLSVFDPKTAAAAPITIARQADGSQLITITRTGALPAELQTALLAERIDSTASGIPTGPSRVGTIMTVAFIGQGNHGRSDSAGRTLTIPTAFTGVVALTIGEAAPPGVLYAQPTDAFGEDEPLDGFGTSRDAVAIYKAAVKKGLQVTVIGSDGNPGAQLLPGDTVRVGSMISSVDLQLHLA